MKITIIGSGNVGSALAYTLVLKGLCSEMVLAGRNVAKAHGDALDLRHTLAFCQRSMRIGSQETGAVRNSDIIVVTASVPLDATMSNRMDLAPGNVALFRTLIPRLAQNNPQAVFIIVSNPVDLLTYLTKQLTGFPAGRVIGIGTLVDSARFRALLSVKEKIHPDDLRAYILGEHGPNQCPVFSSASAGGEPIVDSPAQRALFDEVCSAGHDVLQAKGYTNYAIAAATAEVIQSIVYDDHRTLPLSTYFERWQGIEDNCFSIPVVVGRAGIIRHLHPELNRREREALAQTAILLKEHIRHFLATD